MTLFGHLPGSMAAGILSIVQGTVSMDLSVSAYYAILVSFFPMAIFSLVFLVKNPTDNNNHNKDFANDFEVEARKEISVGERNSKYVNVINSNNKNNNDNPSKALLERKFFQSKVDVVAQLKEEFVFVNENLSLLTLQLLNATLAYGIVPSLLSFACGKFAHRNKVLLFATG